MTFHPSIPHRQPETPICIDKNMSMDLRAGAVVITLVEAHSVKRARVGCWPSMRQEAHLSVPRAETVAWCGDGMVLCQLW